MGDAADAPKTTLTLDAAIKTSKPHLQRSAEWLLCLLGTDASRDNRQCRIRTPSRPRTHSLFDR
jgi:hypothetical protein